LPHSLPPNRDALLRAGEEAIQRAGERLPMLGSDLAECPALGVQVGCTINVHRATVTSLSRIGSNDSDKSWL
jgi:hypothetical protein